MVPPVETPWLHLIRFVSDHDDQVHFGDAILSENFDLGASHNQAVILQAKLIEGNPLSTDCVVHHDRVVSVKKLLGPLTPQMVSSVRCIGMNYASHVAEGSLKLPNYPVMFIKPPNAIADYGQDIEIPKIAQDSQADYEGELVVIIGRDCKNVAKDDAMQHVLGYTVGNDVSTRKWQLDPNLAGKWPQASFSKGFDGFAPLGPCVTAARIINPKNLKLETKVKNQLRQSGNTGSMVFDIATLIAFLSQGTTLEAGSIIMTGTLAGVGFMMDPPQHLTHGDTVEISIEGIGTLVNRFTHAT